jgi:hypothetical protein
LAVRQPQLICSYGLLVYLGIYGYWNGSLLRKTASYPYPDAVRRNGNAAIEKMTGATKAGSRQDQAAMKAWAP